MTPPLVSRPSDSGVTSSSTTSVTLPVSTAPWMAAPTATTSSGLTPLCGSLPKISLTICWTRGIRVEPPTSTTSSMSFGLSLASFSAVSTGPRQRSKRLSVSFSNCARVIDIVRCLGPEASAVMNGRLMSACGLERQVLLGLLGGLLEPLQGHLVLAQVDPLLLLELVGDVVDQRLVPVVAAQVGVAVGREHLEDAVADVEDRDVERAAAQVEDGDLLVLLLLQPVGQRRGGRLVDDPRDLQAGDLAGVLGRLPLAVVEIGRHRDHGLADLVPQVALGRLLELAEDHRRDLGRRVVLLGRVDMDLDVVARPPDDLVGDHLLLGLHLAVAAAHEPLDRVDRPPGIGDGLPLGRVADQDVPLGREGDHRRRQAAPLLVGDDRHVVPLHHRDHAVGRPQVDPDDLFTL